MNIRHLLFACLCLAACAISRAADLPLGHPDFVPTSARPVGWRGDGTGRYPGATPVTDWNIKTGSNVVWQTKLPFFSASGPIVVGDPSAGSGQGKVFTTAEPDLLICLDAKTGKELWRRHNAIFMEELSEPERDRLYANVEKLQDAAEVWMRAPAVYQGRPNGNLGNALILWRPWDDKRVGELDTFDAMVRELAGGRGLDLDGLRTMYNEVGPRAGAGKNPQARATKTPGNRPLIGVPNDYFWHGNAAPTPASDGKVVVAKVGCEQWGYLVCYDLDGNRKWWREIGRTGCWHASYDSPLIIGDVVVSQATIKGLNFPGADGKPPKNDQALLVAFDLATGEPRWRVRTQHSTSSPIPLELDGVKFLHYGGTFLLPEDGTMVLDMTGFYGTDVDTPVVQGDLFFTRGAEGKELIANQETTGRACRSHLFRLAWKTRGKDLGYEVVWRSGLKGGFCLTSNWKRGSPLLHDGWIYVQRGSPRPSLFALNTRAMPQPGADNRPFLVSPDPVLLARPAPQKGEQAIGYGVPNEDDMSVALGGSFIFGCPSDWPSQFIVVPVSPTAATGAELKILSAPVMDAPVVGSPYFQGNRMYVRDYRYLYCIGEK